jgi:hypothetical protein
VQTVPQALLVQAKAVKAVVAALMDKLRVLGHPLAVLAGSFTVAAQVGQRHHWAQAKPEVVAALALSA